MKATEHFIRPGSKVLCADAVCEVADFADLERVVLVDPTGAYLVKGLAEIKVLELPRAFSRNADLLAVDDDQWKKAFEIYRHIKQILDLPQDQRTLAEVEKSAAILGRHSSSVYRWISAYQKTGRISSLLRKKRTDAGVSRLPAEVLSIVSDCIGKHYLSEHRKSISSVAKEVSMACKATGLTPPNATSIRSIILRLDPALVEAKRFSSKRSMEKFSPLRGSFPNAELPRSVVQMDHTPMDVIIVDDIHRKPIGRAHLTIAIDVRSKMVTGFVISIDHPGALATGLCVAMSILPKDEWLREKGIPEKYTWPCYGMMRTIHTDNAKEFKGKMLSRACNEYDIVPERRPKGQPQYGGHVERAFRTFMKKVHEEVPGTTFSNVQDKMDYDSEGKAVMTLSALERWFTVYLLGIYHQEEHKGNNGEPPVEVWTRAHLKGIDGLQPMGLPHPFSPDQRERIQLDFLPCFEATVQQYGVKSWSIDWYSSRIQRFIREKGSDGKARKFICRFDPRNLSTIWLYDDRRQEYIPLPFRVISRPRVSLWEVRAAKKTLQKEGRSTTREALIFEAISYMRGLVQEEAKSTKSARRFAQRQREWEKTGRPNLKTTVSSPTPATVVQDEPILDDSDLLDGIREAN